MKRAERVYLFLNGELLGGEEFYKNFIAETAGDIYCADGGYRHCQALGVEPLEIWGDMDSVDEGSLEKIREKDIRIKKFSRDKDYTDGELILEHLAQLRYKSIYIIGGLGGDKAHELTNINLITRYKNICFLTEKEMVMLVEKGSFYVGKGRGISFIPMTDSVENLTLRGVKYPLENYRLLRWESRCVSNVALDDYVGIEFSQGMFLGIIKIN